jgi:beta-1,4-mannosyl-glycoprotein beta-1,4-N-acetylglucosaminyltransferase
MLVVMLLAWAVAARAKSFCKSHGLEQLLRVQRPKVYDTFIFNHEADMLEIRFYETGAYVDHFVVVESAVSTTGHPRRLSFADIRPRFALFDSKIIHVALPDAGNGSTTWAREEYVRNAQFSQLTGIAEGDIVIASDADELLRASTVRQLKECGGYDATRVRFEMKLYYYSFNLVSPHDWPLAKAFRYSPGSVPTANALRGAADITHTFRDAGWHCSCCFLTIAMIRNKLSSYGHDDITRDPNLYTKEHIVHVVRRGLDLYDRASETYAFIEPSDVPAYVTANAVRFSYLTDRRGPTAGFADFLDV